MEKLDLMKKDKTYYSAKNIPELLVIGQAQFLSIVGKGDPSEAEYLTKIQALYATAYAVKFRYKAMGQDFVVAKLEGLWHFDDRKYASLSMAETPLLVPRSEWSYRMLIRIPDFVARELLTAAIQSILEKKQLPLANEIELYTIPERKVVQMLHIGPFAKEPETLEKIQEFMEIHGLEKNGHHHEVYLSDFNKTHPDRLKTILREPVK